MTVAFANHLAVRGQKRAPKLEFGRPEKQSLGNGTSTTRSKAVNVGVRYKTNEESYMPKLGRSKTGGRKKGTRNKITIVREIHRFHTAEAIEALRSVCADTRADHMARVQAACKLIDLLPSELLRTKGVLPCGHQDLANATDGCLKTAKTKEPDTAGVP